MTEETKKSLTLEDIPVRRELEDGKKLLAEAAAYLVLEGGRTAHCAGYVAEHKVQLLRLPTDARGPRYQLIVHKREGESDDKERVITLDNRCRVSPALRRVRKETHFVKPDGESLFKAITSLSGEEIKLYTFEVFRPGNNPFLNLLGFGQQRAMLGFKKLEEALGWYIYIAACANVMETHDPDFNKVIGHQMTLSEHAAASPALVLHFDDTPEKATAAATKAPATEAAQA